MGHISSLANRAFLLLNGNTSDDPFVAACLRVGGDGPADRGLPEFTIADARRRAADGFLTWDPDHRRNGSASPFFSVAAVRLDLKPDGECLLSVGTSEFVRLVTAPYRWIEKIQIVAAAGTDAPQRAIQWDSIELTMLYADGRTETRQSSCLPRVATGAPLRRAAQASDARPIRLRQQFAEISTGSHDVVEVKVRGQVTLRANDPVSAASPLAAEDLQGRILVFTDASSGRG